MTVLSFGVGGWGGKREEEEEEEGGVWGKMEGDREVRRRLSVTSNNDHNNNLFMLGVCMYV